MFHIFSLFSTGNMETVQQLAVNKSRELKLLHVTSTLYKKIFKSSHITNNLYNNCPLQNTVQRTLPTHRHVPPATLAHSSIGPFYTCRNCLLRNYSLKANAIKYIVKFSIKCIFLRFSYINVQCSK